jgi:hypothetical protein
LILMVHGGQVFERMTVLERVENGGQGDRWLCVCSCAKKTQRIVNGANLRRGHTKSCGCLFHARSLEASIKHGERHSPEYNIMRHARQRCSNSKNDAYENYGGRGIKFNFPGVGAATLWVINNIGRRPSKKHVIDRIDNNGHYEPGNLRWATRKQSVDNRRNTIVIEAFGKIAPIMNFLPSQDSRAYSSIWRAIHSGIVPEIAITNALKPRMNVAPFTNLMRQSLFLSSR